MEENNCPVWASGRNINEQAFIYDFLQTNRLTCQNNRFYGVNGPVEDSKVREVIYTMLRKHYQTGLKEKVESILWAMRLELCGNDIHTGAHEIHVRNGTLDLRKGFTDYKCICQNRLPVRYDENAPKPEHWLRFVEALLEPEDILTLQEYLGYCLIPSNAAQKMLMILGDGGEGKSRIGVMMSLLLGSSMITCPLDKIEHDRFARSNLEGKLLMVDDDLNLDALKTTHHIKSIITADTPMDLERKGEQSYQGYLNCRFLCFGNGNLRSLHDRSHGFYRRQIILHCKEKDPNRLDDPYLAHKFIDELDGIFLWCLEGLRRLQANHMEFTISRKSEENLKQAVLESNNIIEFVCSQGYIAFDPNFTTTTRHLYAAYNSWCNDNATKPLSIQTFSNYLISKQQILGISYSNNIYCGEGKRSRGFVGLRVLF